MNKHIYIYRFLPLLAHAFNASGDDQASILVPPQLDSTKPIGRLMCDDRYFPYNQHTAEKPGNEAGKNTKTMVYNDREKKQRRRCFLWLYFIN